MTQKLWGMVGMYRKEGVMITDEEADKVYQICLRKLEIAKIKEVFLPDLYECELKNYLLRRTINEASMVVQTFKDIREIQMNVV